MACLDMYNSDHKSLHRRAPASSPRISFSSDFIDIQQSLKHQEQRSAAAPPPVSSSSDFEFSVSNYSMMPADELFFEGRLLPYKDSNRAATTLRDELLIEEEEEDDEDNDTSQRPSSRGRWKGFLGLKKSHNNSSKKGCRNDGSSGSHDVGNGKRPFGWSSSSPSTRANSSHQVQNEGESSCKDVEIDF